MKLLLFPYEKDRQCFISFMELAYFCSPDFTSAHKLIQGNTYWHTLYWSEPLSPDLAIRNLILAPQFQRIGPLLS